MTAPPDPTTVAECTRCCSGCCAPPTVNCSTPAVSMPGPPRPERRWWCFRDARAAEGNPRHRRHRPRIARRRGCAFRVALLDPATSRALAPRYGFARWPAFVVLKDGRYVGAIDGLRDWDVYVAEMRRLLAAEPTRPPTVGIAVRAAGASNEPPCH